MTSARLRFWAILVAWITVGLLEANALVANSLLTAQPEEVGVSSEKVEGLSNFMRSLVDEGKIAGGVTMMARHGKVIHLKAVGMSDREAKKPMQTDSIFRIASMTKPITSVAIIMLHQQDKLNLDDPVSKYITEFKNPKVLLNTGSLKTRAAEREITIRDLLTHTSGLGYDVTERIGPIYRRNGIEWGLCTTSLALEQNIRTLARLPLLFDPGTKYQYGMSTDVLGRVVEVASAATFDRFVERNICKPLGMSDTFFHVPAEKRSRLVAAYIPTEGGIQRIRGHEVLEHDLQIGLVTISSDYPYAESHKYFSGGAGLCSTAADYMRFCQMLLNGGQLDGVRLLRESTVKMMTKNQIGNLKEDGGFGLGFGVKPDTEDVHEQLRSSYDWGGFWSTSFRISPRGDWILITMSQLAWDDKATPAWFTRYEGIAAEAIAD